MKQQLLLLAALALPAASGHAALVYSGFQNISISSTFDSTYIDVDAVTSGTSQNPGWDIDAFFGGEAFGNSANFQPVRETASASSAVLSLELGDLVDAADFFAAAEAGSTTHIGTLPNQFASGVTDYLGFRLTTNSGAGPYYGWMRVNFSNTGNAGSIIDWVYDTSGAGINVGAIPEPSAAVLLGLATSLTLLGRRRRV
jgi:hypothetical protein